jgi:GDP-L-fucose synthase
VSATLSRAFWDGKQVVVTGGAGFLGRPTVELLLDLGAEVRVPRSAEYDLRDRDACFETLAGAEVVVHLAATVGGIEFNRRNPGPLVYDNLAMATNVFEAARRRQVHKLVAACSVCAYPHSTPVPFRETDIWNGYPEASNAPYGLAKKMLIVLGEAYREQYGLDSAIPVFVNLYGPGDNFDLEDSHVIAAMVRKFCEAADRGDAEVVLWGSGEPTREFLYVDDAARALVLAGERLRTSAPVNIGTGTETRIRDLAEAVAAAAGFGGEVVWDRARPDGQPRRCLDVSRAAELLGFEAEVPLAEGLDRTVAWFRDAVLHQVR